MSRILNFGSLNLDTVYRLERFPAPGETVTALEQYQNAGGKGLNQSVAASRAGAAVCHAGCVGQGGEALRTLLEDNGVDTAFLRAVDVPQGNAVIQVDASGQNCILIYGGSNRCVKEEQVCETISAFDAGDWLLLQNEINALPLIVEKAAERGLHIVLNPSPFEKSLLALDFQKLDWLILNELEAEQLFGSCDPERCAALLREHYPRLSLLLTLGESGSVAVTGRGICRRSAFPVKAVDTTAAGDTYTGYWIAAMSAGKSLEESMRRASMAAALSVTRPGAARSIPTGAEVDEALQHIETEKTDKGE